VARPPVRGDVGRRRPPDPDGPPTVDRDVTTGERERDGPDRSLTAPRPHRPVERVDAHGVAERREVRRLDVPDVRDGSRDPRRDVALVAREDHVHLRTRPAAAAPTRPPPDPPPSYRSVRLC
jgi:hypothetical protein